METQGHGIDLEYKIKEMQDTIKHLSDQQTTVAETMRFDQRPQPINFWEQNWMEHKLTVRQFHQLEQRSIDETWSANSPRHDPTELQRTPRHIPDSSILQRPVKRSGPSQKLNSLKVSQGAVKPGSNTRTRRKKEQRHRQAAKAKSEGIIGPKKSRARRSKWAKERSILQETVIHGGTDMLPQKIDGSAKRRGTRDSSSRSTDVSTESDTAWGLSDQRSGQVVSNVDYPPAHDRVEAFLLEISQDLARREEMMKRPAKDKGKEIIRGFFGQGFIDNVKTICEKKAAQGNADIRSRACELTIVNVKKKTDVCRTCHFDFTKLEYVSEKNKKGKRPVAADFKDFDDTSKPD